jgi:hypothetical protein
MEGLSTTRESRVCRAAGPNVNMRFKRTHVSAQVSLALAPPACQHVPQPGGQSRPFWRDSGAGGASVAAVFRTNGDFFLQQTAPHHLALYARST